MASSDVSSRPAAPIASSFTVALFAGCIFASAFLLFQVQPMVGKRILPWFGGVPGVWTLCLAFYQVTLFLGYAYAHLLTRLVAPRRQPAIHALLFAAALASLPVLPGIDWKPGGSAAPTGRILAMLAANVGLPFLFLAASGPLVQAWFVRAAPRRSPYVLYAVSNGGSFLALLSYPFVIEPAVPLSLSALFWTFGLALVGLAVVTCAWLARGPRTADEHEPERGLVEPLAWTDALLWFALSACAVVLLMGVTNELCLDVASIPFLWVAPLALYLVTFIVCFSAETPRSRGWLVALAAASLAALALTGSSSLVSGSTGAADITVLVGVHSLVLLFHCLVLHRELYALRPAPERLTTYYLCISFGGAAGGLFVGIGAPRWFSDYYEMPLSLVACWVLVALCWLRGARFTSPGFRRALVAGVAAAGLAAAIFSVQPGQGREGSVIFQLRNFFGVLRVVEIEPERPRHHRRALKSGTTLHGLQFAGAPGRDVPTLYYGEFTGIGFALRAATTAGPARIGVVGLGVGTLAAYGRSGDSFRFYEIDPDVIRIARDANYFRYLADASADIEIVEGDARLSLEREFDGGEDRARDGQQVRLDVLVLDAFSSDAIPVHLLTAEAFGVYARALRDDGLLAVHVSNANLELAPLVLALGSERGMRGVVIENRQTPRVLQARATWVVLSRDVFGLDAVERAVEARRLRLPEAKRDPWLFRPTARELAAAPRFTDDYSDVFRLLK